jgi:hypothetical protein
MNASILFIINTVEFNVDALFATLEKAYRLFKDKAVYLRQHF